MASLRRLNGALGFNMQEYYPENTSTTLYIRNSFNDYSLAELLEQAKDHFPGVIDLEQLTIRSEKIHCRCLTYDLYDSSDWDDYIIIEHI